MNTSTSRPVRAIVALVVAVLCFVIPFKHNDIFASAFLGSSITLWLETVLWDA